MPAPRNLIIIQSDQHRGDWLGCAGADWVHTPHLDALAGRGVRFEQAYCSYPLCGPSRMSFLTGRHPFRNGLHTNEESLPSHIPTFAHALGLGGYHNVLCGRMHFCGPDQRHGFRERIFGDYNPCYPGGPLAEIPKELQQASVGRAHSVRIAGTMERNYFLDYDEGVTRAAEDYLTSYAAQSEPAPLALTVGFFLPHSPFSAPERFVQRARERAARMPDPVPPAATRNGWEEGYLANQGTADMSAADFREARIQYAAMIDYMDERVGRVLTAAEQLPGETMVCYFSDHGEMAGDHANINKGCLAESSLQVPWIWAPLKDDAAHRALIAEPGRSVRAPVSLVDLVPTLCALADAPPPPDLDGASLAPAITGTDRSDLHERTIFAEVEIFATLNGHLMGPARMARRGALKYVHYHFHDDALYDIDRDPEEHHNLIDDPAHRQAAAELLAAILEEWDPELLHRQCERAWRRLPYISRWGREIGQQDLGMLEVWPGAEN